MSETPRIPMLSIEDARWSFGVVKCTGVLVSDRGGRGRRKPVEPSPRA